MFDPTKYGICVVYDVCYHDWEGYGNSNKDISKTCEENYQTAIEKLRSPLFKPLDIRDSFIEGFRHHPLVELREIRVNGHSYTLQRGTELGQSAADEISRIFRDHVQLINTSASPVNK